MDLLEAVDIVTATMTDVVAMAAVETTMEEVAHDTMTTSDVAMAVADVIEMTPMAVVALTDTKVVDEMIPTAAVAVAMVVVTNTAAHLVSVAVVAAAAAAITTVTIVAMVLLPLVMTLLLERLTAVVVETMVEKIAMLQDRLLPVTHPVKATLLQNSRR